MRAPGIEEVARDTLFIGVETPNGIYSFGTLSLIAESDGRTLYEYDFNEERFNMALRMSNDPMLPGFDPQYGYKQRHDKEIAFIYERAFHPGRPDLDEVLKPWSMTAADYNKWEFIKRSRGIHFRDKWRVTPDATELTDECC